MATKTVKDLLQATGKFLYRLGFRKPWQITGPRSLPEFVEYMPSAMEYRAISPGSQLVKAKIPHDHPSIIYNIAYFKRDYRRNNWYEAKSVKVSEGIDYEKLFASAPLTPKDIKEVPVGEMPTRGM